TGALWGWPLPDGLPIWAAILVLALLFHLITSPLRIARRAYRRGWGWPYAWFALWEGLAPIVVFALGAWLISRNMPEVHSLREFFHYLPDAVSASVHEVAAWFRHAIG